MLLLIIVLALLAGIIVYFISTNLLSLIFYHAVYYCANVIHNFIIPFPNIMTLTIVFIIGLYFLWIIVNLLLFSFNTLNLVVFSTRNINTELSYVKKLELYGIDKNTILLNSNSLQAFCFGFFNPKIYISTKILDTFNRSEIMAIWFHENYHRTNYHSFKRVIRNFAILFTPVFPLIKDLAKEQMIKDEILADKAVLKHLKKDYLISSLKKLIISVDYPTSVTFFAAYDTLLQRINSINEVKISKTDYVKSTIFSVVSLFVLLTICTSLVQAKTINSFKCTNKECLTVCKNSNLKIPYLNNVSLPISILYSPKS